MPQLDLLILNQNINISLISYFIWVFPAVWFCIKHMLEILHFKVLLCFYISNQLPIFYLNAI